ncbi:hypothetical protein V5799_026502 [Amblyomma americanum]|uniref:Methyltransferase domain-containing protein n=1 Tax=Amblyomma americanum TaxID=6943 RepID=A0AAQ4DIE0_AMBAM
MGSLDTSAPTSLIANGDVTSPGCRKERMNPVGYDHHESYLWQLDRAALGRTTFLREPHVDHQHLDVGCGVGGFTRNVLLPLGGSATRIVAADISPSMLQFARENNALVTAAFVYKRRETLS